MHTIWKFEIPRDRVAFELDMPEDAKILCVQMQNGTPMLWAELSSLSPLQVRQFQIVGTGREIPKPFYKYIATWQDGPFVWHLYEAE